MQAECNVGGIDRAFRIGLGTGLMALGLTLPMNKWLGIGLETVGIMSAVTGLGEYCPISKLVGLNTCQVREGAA